MTRTQAVDGAPFASDRIRSTRTVREKFRRQRLTAVHLPPGQDRRARATSPRGPSWLDRAWSALAVGDFIQAAYAAGMCRGQGELAQAALIRARATAGLGLLGEAVIEGHRAVQLAPDEPDHHVTLGEIFAELGNMTAAARSYRNAERLSPDSTGARVGWALLAAQAGETAQAEQLLERVYATGQDQRLAGDCLGLVLVEAAERVPRVRQGERYVITAPEEITRMRVKLARAVTVAVDPDLHVRIGEVRTYVEACARRAWSWSRPVPVARWKLNLEACERQEQHARPPVGRG